MRFDLDTPVASPSNVAGDSEETELLDKRNLDRIRKSVVGEACDLLDRSGAVTNRNRLFTDLFNREKRTGTAVGEGIAFPHVRTMQVKRFVMAFGRSTEGLPFRAPDDEPVHLFFAMVSPPYEDRIYLKVYRALASALLHEEHRGELMEAWSPNEVWRVLEVFR